MKYAAYLKIENRMIRVFPRTKKTSFFKKVDVALKALERKAKNFNFDTFGFVYDTDNNIITNIAL